MQDLEYKIISPYIYAGVTDANSIKAYRETVTQNFSFVP